MHRWFFFDGITNGADWYPLYGGMQDFNYIYSNDMEITMELSCCKYPKKYYLNKEWERNKVSLIKYLQQVHSGVKGMVMTTSLSNGETPLSNAVITVEDSTGTNCTLFYQSTKLIFGSSLTRTYNLLSTLYIINICMFLVHLV